MEKKELMDALEALKSDLEASIETKAAKNFEEKMAAVNTAIAELKAVKPEVTAEELKAVKDNLDATIKALDIVQNRQKSKEYGTTQYKSFGSELEEKLTAKAAQLTAFKYEKKGFEPIELQSKAVGNMSSAGNLTGSYFVAPTVIPGVIPKIYEQAHMRDILPTGSTNSNTIRYIRDNGGEGGPGMVAEGATKPQIDRDLLILDANVRKIATYFRLPEEMIEDIPYLTSFLSTIGIEEVMKVEDAQILYGDGTGQNLSGLFTNATAFAAGTSIVQAPNNFDVLLAARKQGRIALRNTNVALVSPVDYFDMIEKKDTTNNYLFMGGGNGIDAAGVLNVKGMKIIEHTAIVAGDFLVLDPMSAAIFDRTGTTVRFYDQDQDNAIKNLITIVIEKRLALPIYRTDGLIKGTFATAIADLTT